MADVFISYRRTERPLLQPIVTALRELDLTPWFDASLSAGERFDEEINREVEDAKVVFVCWSPDALKSDYVQGEAWIGYQKQKLVSTWIAGPDNPAMPVPYNKLQMEDLRSWIASPDSRHPAWRSVLRSIGRLTERSDIFEWSQLDEGASIRELNSWVQRHGEDNPLAPDVMNLLEYCRTKANHRRRDRVPPPSPPDTPISKKPAPSVWRRLFGGARGIAVDLGTANTRIYVPDEGIVLDERSVVAVCGGRATAFGDDVKPLLTRRPESVEIISPLRGGVIENPDCATEMLRHFIGKVRSAYPIRSRFEIVIGTSAGAMSIYRRALRDCALKAWASEVFLMETPLAAAIGAGMDFQESVGSLIVEIGAGRGEIAVVSVRGLTHPEPLGVSGVGMDDAIAEHLRQSCSLRIDSETAERIKKQLGVAAGADDGEDVSMPVRGNHFAYGVPKEMKVNQRQVTDALNPLLGKISRALYHSMENTPPEHSGGVLDRGILLTGGTALLQGLDQIVRDETGLPVQLAERPLWSVANGMGRVLEDRTLRSLLFAL